MSARLVGKLMREQGLRSCAAQRFHVQTTDSKHEHPIAPNILNQTFVTTAPNKVWLADITYIPCQEGRLYLASVMDLYTRKIVGWKMCDHMRTDLVGAALEQAHLSQKPPAGVLHHSDQERSMPLPITVLNSSHTR